MNNYYILGFVVAVALVLFLFASGEFKGSIIVPEYVPFMKSQKGASRGGELMYEIEDLGVPGWKWGDCCSGSQPSGIN